MFSACVERYVGLLRLNLHVWSISEDFWVSNYVDRRHYSSFMFESGAVYAFMSSCGVKHRAWPPIQSQACSDTLAPFDYDINTPRPILVPSRYRYSIRVLT